MPTKTLTARFVEAVKPIAKRTEYFDTYTTGLALRVSDRGIKTWVLLYRTQPDDDPQTPPADKKAPRLRRLTLGRYPDLDLKAARRKAEIQRGKIANGNDPAGVKQALRRTPQRRDTVGDLAQDYLEKYAKVKKRSWREDDRMLSVEVLPHWKARSVKSLTRRDVRELVEAIADGGAPITANRCLALIRKMLNFAIEKDWVDANVASRIEKPGVERSRDRVLTDDDLRQVWQACAHERPAMCALMRLRLVTAQRGGEIAKITWADVEGDWLTIPASVTKNKKPHRVFLTKTAKDLIDELPRLADSDYLFPGRSGKRPCGDAKKAGQRIAARVWAERQTSDPTVARFDFRGHDLRRTASTRMAEAGVPQADIAKVLNHAEGGPRATHVYNRYQYDREKRIALETWERVLTRILQHRNGGNVVPLIGGGAR